MSVFDSTAATSGILNVGQLTSELESSLPAKWGWATDGSSASTTAGGGSPATRLAASPTVAADEILVVHGVLVVSTGTSGAQVTCRIKDVGSGLYYTTYSWFYGPRANTGGADGTLRPMAIFENLSGSRTINLEWWTSTGTVYSGYADLFYLIFKKR